MGINITWIGYNVMDMIRMAMWNGYDVTMKKSRMPHQSLKVGNETIRLECHSRLGEAGVSKAMW
jgi:hypothetical protein